MVLGSLARRGGRTISRGCTSELRVEVSDRFRVRDPPHLWDEEVHSFTQITGPSVTVRSLVVPDVVLGTEIAR